MSSKNFVVLAVLAAIFALAAFAQAETEVIQVALVYVPQRTKKPDFSSTTKMRAARSFCSPTEKNAETLVAGGYTIPVPAGMDG